MIGSRYVSMMAAYNRWQNENLYRASESLSDEERRRDRGAFWGSIFRTLNHILWADQLWHSRFTGTPRPHSVDIEGSAELHPDWESLVSARHACDETLSSWAQTVEPAFLNGDVTWHSGAMGREVTRPAGLLVTHMFNHQTHHRGQVHVLLTATGARPSDTDLAFMTLP